MHFDCVCSTRPTFAAAAAAAAALFERSCNTFERFHANPAVYLHPCFLHAQLGTANLHEAVSTDGGGKGDVRSGSGDNVADVYALQSRSQVASFAIDRPEWIDREHLDVKCVATIGGYPWLTRERVRRIRLLSGDRLNNDRLVNVKGGATGEHLCYVC